MTSDQQTKLDALRAERAALADAAAARLEPSVDEQIAIEERLLVEDQALADAVAKFGPRAVSMVRMENGTSAVILRKPHISAYRKYQDAGDATTENTGEFVRSCLIYPSGGAAFERLVEQTPALLAACARACAELAGHRRKDLSAK